MSGLAIVALFLLLAAAMIARRLPALLAIPILALGIAALAGAGWSGIGNVLGTGSVLLAPTIVTLVFGAWLSRVVLSTGIAETIVGASAEFGGDRPMVVALVLCAAVALLFTSVTGLGAIIMIGTIVLPVMMTVGVPRTTAATLFLMAFGIGYIFNLAQWTFYRQLFGVDQSAFGAYVWVLAAINVAVLIVYAAVRARAMRDYAAFSVAGPPQAKRRVSPFALVTPVLPLLLYKAAGLDALASFALAALYGTLVTKPRDAVQTLVAALIRGVEDVAPALVLMIGIGMLLAAARLPAVQAAVAPLVAAAAPRSPLAYVLVFGILSPLALYRGPLNIYGVGVGVFTVLATMHVLPALALVAAVMAVVQVQNVCDPTNTQNVWVANFTGVGVATITRLTLPYQAAVATLATVAVVVFGPVLFGQPVFALARPAAAADWPGLFAPAEAANVVGVLAQDPRAQTLTPYVEHTLAAWPGIRTQLVAGDPAATDCARKSYSAVLRISVTPLVDGPADVGLELLDCAGWSVDQWHEQGRDLPKLSLDALFRVRTWMGERPALARELFSRGLAYDSARDGATYFYLLYKPADGYMRALVRPGGPAWVAGLRSGDIVDTIDGRHWWEYGTYQTQLKAYDGKPHAFGIYRGGPSGTPHAVTLGAPFAG